MLLEKNGHLPFPCPKQEEEPGDTDLLVKFHV
jgi:hypothetical protein